MILLLICLVDERERRRFQFEKGKYWNWWKALADWKCTENSDFGKISLVSIIQLIQYWCRRKLGLSVNGVHFSMLNILVSALFNLVFSRFFFKYKKVIYFYGAIDVFFICKVDFRYLYKCANFGADDREQHQAIKTAQFFPYKSMSKTV